MSPDDPKLPPTGVLFERYGAMVFRRCLRMLQSEEEAKDAVQEVFLNVLLRREQFRGDAAPSTWLYGAATLQCLQRIRNRDGRAQKLKDAAHVVIEEHGAPNDDHLALLRLLEHEPDEVRVMIYCRYVDGMTMEEVADVVGRSRKTVSAHVQAFVQQARGQLELGETP